MSSALLAKIHFISALLFLILYLVKLILLFTNKKALQSMTAVTKVPEMIISTLFLVTGVWLLVILGGIKLFHIIKLVFVFLAIPLGVIGFKKQRYAAAILSVLFIVLAYGMAEMSKNKPFLPAKVVMNNDDGSPLAQGAKVYHANCVFCHGTDGKKMYRTAPDLSTSNLDALSMQGMITDGSKGKMPAYGKVLSAEEIAQVALYVQSLKTGSNIQVNP